MKIKITQPGWETFTGNFGSIEFADGVSVGEVSQNEASRVAAVVRVETTEGKDPSMAQLIIDTYSDPAPLETTIAAADLPKPEVPSYTADELAAIADKLGIKGLREIADPLGIKANSIAELIGRILAVSKPAEPTVTAEAAPEAAEPAAEPAAE